MRYLKTLATESEGILHVLGNPFYGPERGADSDGQYFDEKTDFMDEAGIIPPVFYWHGSRTKSIPYQIADVTKTWMTDEGRWYEVSLYTKAEQFASNVIEKGSDTIQEILDVIKTLWKSALNGTLFASTGAVPASVIVEDNGRIAQWLVGELSLIDADAGEGRVPANFYASAIPVKLNSEAFEKLQRKQFFEFENLSITIPGGNVPQSLPNEIKSDYEGEEESGENESMFSSVASAASQRFNEVLDTVTDLEGVEDEVSDVIGDVVYDVISEAMPMISVDDIEQMSSMIAMSVFDMLNQGSEQKSLFDENFIDRAFEQAFLEVFQSFRSEKQMPDKTIEENDQQPQENTDLEAQLAQMREEMNAMKSSNDALTQQLRQAEASSATVQAQSFLDGMVKDGRMTAQEVESWLPVFNEAYSLDTAVKSSGGEGKMIESLMSAMKTRPQASILSDGDRNDDDGDGDQKNIKSGTILSASAGKSIGGPDHTKVDPDTLNEMRRYVGVSIPQ